MTAVEQFKKVVLVRAGNSGGSLPHALLSLAANLDDEVLILDEATPNLVLKHKDTIKNALCIGISTITGTFIKDSLEVARTIRLINPDVPLIWGGWHPSLKPEQTLENKYVDAVVVGQGEYVFRSVVERLKNGDKIDTIITHEYIDKSKFPIYNFDSIRNMERYIIPYISPRTISLYTTQGCPFGCAFCAINSVYGRRYSYWPIEGVINLISQSISKYAINGIHFDDDNFFIGKDRPLEFADGLLKRNIEINWSADARVDTLCNLEPEEWQMLDKSGFKWGLIGAESGSQITLDKLNKRITREEILEVGNLCYKHNITPCFSMMVGVPGETAEDIEETFKLIDTLEKNVPTSELFLSFYMPYPGTSLFSLSLEMGFKEPESLGAWSECYLSTPNVPWISKDLIKRVRKYNRRLPANRDISLKHKKRSISTYIYKSHYPLLLLRFIKTKDKKKTLLKYFKTWLNFPKKKSAIEQSYLPLKSKIT
jgi:radical SAM superfamily enzyme YgiQ (UPF0313 family)